MRRPKRLPMEQLAPHLLDVSRPNPLAPASILDWPQVFGNDHPVEIEVGSGKGAFLVATAEAHPDTNYLGIEIDKALHYYIATRLAKRGLTNARVAGTDARALLTERVRAGSVRGVHVYFPDPWWKKRHHKRRVWTPEFAAECVRVLAPGGRLHVATDVGDYYQIIRDLLEAQADLVRQWADETAGPPAPDEALTNFERKARQRGGAVYRAEYERR